MVTASLISSFVLGRRGSVVKGWESGGLAGENGYERIGCAYLGGFDWSVISMRFYGVHGDYVDGKLGLRADVFTCVVCRWLEYWDG